jgi:hypothetical protein
VFLGGVAKINSILVMVLRNTNKHFGAVAGDGLKTSSLSDYAKKCRHATRPAKPSPVLLAMVVMVVLARRWL